MQLHRRNILGKVLAFLLFLPVSLLGQSTTSTWESLGPEGGYLTCIAQNPVNGDLYTTPYGYPMRVFKSTNYGGSWTQIGGISGYGEFLVIDPKQPTTIYAYATNVAYSGGRFYVQKSSDGGASWAQKTASGETDRYYWCRTFAIDDANAQKLTVSGYCSKSTGTSMPCPFLSTSTDGGNTWATRTLTNVTSNDFHAYFVKSDPSIPATKYAGGYTFEGGNYYGRFYKTTDDGVTWTNITGSIIQGYCYDMLIDPASPNKIYVVTYSGVYRSTDRGATWLRNNGVAMGTKLLPDPKNNSILYAYGNGLTVYRSTDGGVNWGSLNSNLSGGSCNALLINSSATNKIYTVTRSGFYRSDNTGQDWTSSNKGLVCGEIPVLRCDPSSPSTLYISFLYSGFYRTVNGLANPGATLPVTWEKMPEYSYCEGIMSLEISPTNPNNIYIQEGAS